MSASTTPDKLRDTATAAMTASRHFPQSTYRLQFHAGFTFQDARRIVPYLRDLGITHIYASPILRARAGSMHGYDVIDPHSLNPELGSAEDFAAYTDALKEHGLELILDIVPNHMGIATNDNAWWNDVLENGPGSRHAGYFDIAWRGSLQPQLHDKVLLPVLGEPYREALEHGKLRLVQESGKFFIAYYDRRFPVNAVGYARISSAPSLGCFNGNPSDSHSFDRLDDLLASQFYRLAYWRTAPDEINYRRFFDINDLAALCVEKEDVFKDVHQLIFQLLGEGKISGLRVDHPDGLFDPAQYFRRLRREAPRRGDGQTSLYVVAEKILASDEPLPRDWAVHGTTGYDFINKINGLFIDPASVAVFTRRYADWAGDQTSFDEICYQKKRLILKISLASELQTLAHRLDYLAQRNRNWREFALADIHEALREVIACFPVYRTYIADGKASESDRQVIECAIRSAIKRNPHADPSVLHLIRDALLKSGEHAWREDDEAARQIFAGKFQQLTAPVTAKGIEDTAFYIYNRLISLNEVGGDPAIFGIAPAALHQWLQQRRADWPLSLSPLSTHDTKRSEDVRARLNVLSELPDEWWQCLERWSRMNEPHRGKVAGSPSPAANDEILLYQALVGAWPLDAGEGQPPADFVKRIQDYMRKAIREAKTHTSWTDPNCDYELALGNFVAAILSRDKSQIFLGDFLGFQHRVRQFGLLNSLSQTLLRLTAPGIPDTYQGTELWDFSLVDPDNRRPVDYPRRRQMLDQLMTALSNGRDRALLVRELVAAREDGRIKLFMIWQSLTARRECPDLFTSGEYIPVQVAGSRQGHVFSFMRRHGNRRALVAVPRLLSRLASPGALPLGTATWGDTRLILPAEVRQMRLQDRFTSEWIALDSTPDGPTTLQVANLFKHLPLSLLLWQDG